MNSTLEVIEEEDTARNSEGTIFARRPMPKQVDEIEEEEKVFEA